MAYMPKENCHQYLDNSKMTKIYDLSQPWGVDTPLWPFPGARQDLQFPGASTWAGSTREP